MNIPHRHIRNRIVWMGLFPALLAGIATAATYYVDPATGSMSNPGTSAAPWSTLQAVFSAGKTFAAGDTICLRNGYHGAPQIRGLNTGTVTIQAQSGHVPTLKTLDTYNASYWTIDGLDISPANTSTVLNNSSYLVSFRSNCSNLVLQNCHVHSVADAVDVTQWSVTDWNQAANGMRCDSPNSAVLASTFKNVNFGVVVMPTATHSLVSGNIIENFSKDGLRGLADDCEFSYNLVTNSYLALGDGDSNHDDGFQSWSTGTGGVAGTGTISNVTLRGNIFISSTDPDQPFKGDMQGIGCFDGMFRNWVVENNMVAVPTTNGIAFYGATDCRIVNNTVFSHPVFTSTISVGPARIGVFAHKTGTQSSNVLIRNNLSGALYYSGGTYTADHNLTSTSYSSYVVDYPGFDFHLKDGSPAIDAGSATLAPAIDCDQAPRTAPYDVGCYEYQPPNAHGGTRSARGVFSYSPSWTNLSQTPTGIVTGTTYVASVWIKGPGSVQLTVRAGFWGTALTTMRCDATSAWTQFTTSAFSTGSNSQLTLVLQDSYSSEGTIYVDDAFLGVGGGANKLANPGFESGTSPWGISSTSIWTIGQF